MATLNSAIQTLVDNLQAKMLSEAPLSAEEQTLIASAIEKLSVQTNLERALVAVATEHLDSATNTLSSTLSSASSALSAAQEDIDASTSALITQQAQLDQIPQLRTELQTSMLNASNTNQQQLKQHLAAMTRRVFGVKHVETPSTSGSYQRSQAVFAVYDASGDSYLTRPSYVASTSNTEHERLEYIKLLADGSGKSVLRSHFVNSNTFYANPGSSIYQYGCSAMIPLARKDDAQDIDYDIVYSTQSTNSNNASSYRGVYIRGAGHESVTKPKLNVIATDQWGLNAIAGYAWQRVGLLYDNQKHCIVMVDNSTSLLIEKYRDANLVTDISIADSAAMQTYVDAGDFTVVYLIKHHQPQIYGHYKHTKNLLDGSIGHYTDMFGYYGKVGNVTRMGQDHYCAHYRFTAAKKLEPLNYFFSSSVTAYRTENSSGTANGEGECIVCIVDFSGHPLGMYEYQSRTDYRGYSAGYVAGSIMAINPYSHTGLLNDRTSSYSNNANYGVGRTCKAF